MPRPFGLNLPRSRDDAGQVLYYAGSVTVNEDIGSAQYGQAYDTMSSFSSWGVPGSLELKPEITAPRRQHLLRLWQNQRRRRGSWAVRTNMK